MVKIFPMARWEPIPCSSAWQEWRPTTSGMRPEFVPSMWRVRAIEVRIAPSSMNYRREDRGSVKMQRKPLGALFGPSNTPYCSSFSCSSLVCQVRATNYWFILQQLAHKVLFCHVGSARRVGQPEASGSFSWRERPLGCEDHEESWGGSHTDASWGQIHHHLVPWRFARRHHPRGTPGEGLGRAALSYHWLLTAWWNPQEFMSVEMKCPEKVGLSELFR